MNFNKVFFGGRLTRDVSVKFLPSQMQVAEFGLAMSTKRTNKTTGETTEVPCFIDCAAFGKTAEIIGKHFQKGKAIFVEGSLRFESWEDKNGGGKRSKLSLVVDSFQFVGPPDGTGGSTVDTSSSQERRPSQSRPAPSSAPAKPEEDASYTMDDIPFHWEGRHDQPV